MWRRENGEKVMGENVCTSLNVALLIGEEFKMSLIDCCFHSWEMADRLLQMGRTKGHVSTDILSFLLRVQLLIYVSRYFSSSCSLTEQVSSCGLHKTLTGSDDVLC